MCYLIIQGKLAEIHVQTEESVKQMAGGNSDALVGSRNGLDITVAVC